MSNRRDFLRKSALLGLGGLAGSALGKTALHTADMFGQMAEPGKITLPPLPYASNALEPYIDQRTMEIHHGKHHQAYVDKLNTVPADQFNAAIPLEESCAKINSSSSALLRNNLGGHYNHSLFWNLLLANPQNNDNKPAGKLAESINSVFGSYENFNKEFSDKAMKIFGSGWCWLIRTEKGIAITTTANQDNPLMQVAPEQGRPVLALDVWEHAYYLKYQNKRADYIAAWWHIVNWKKAEELFSA